MFHLLGYVATSNTSGPSKPLNHRVPRNLHTLGPFQSPHLSPPSPYTLCVVHIDSFTHQGCHDRNALSSAQGSYPVKRFPPGVSRQVKRAVVDRQQVLAFQVEMGLDTGYMRPNSSTPVPNCQNIHSIPESVTSFPDHPVLNL